MAGWSPQSVEMWSKPAQAGTGKLISEMSWGAMVSSMLVSQARLEIPELALKNVSAARDPISVPRSAAATGNRSAMLETSVAGSSPNEAALVQSVDSFRAVSAGVREVLR